MAFARSDFVTMYNNGAREIVVTNAAAAALKSLLPTETAASHAPPVPKTQVVGTIAGVTVLITVE